MEIEVESGCRSNVNINMKNKQAEEKSFHVCIRGFLPALLYLNFSQKHSACETSSFGTPELLLFPPPKVHRGKLLLPLGDTVSTSLSESNSLVYNSSSAALTENLLASTSESSVLVDYLSVCEKWIAQIYCFLV